MISQQLLVKSDDLVQSNWEGQVLKFFEMWPWTAVALNLLVHSALIGDGSIEPAALQGCMADLDLLLIHMSPPEH